MWYRQAFAVAAMLILAAAVCGEWRVESSDDSGIAPPPAIAFRLPAPDLRPQPSSDVPVVKQTRAPETSCHRSSVIRTRYLAEQPLSAQERLLLAFVRENPQEILSTVEWQEHMRQPADEQTPPDQGEQ
jgi:hypothetical protein